MGSSGRLGCARDSRACAGPAQLESSKLSITIQFATDAYLANRAGRNIAPATVRKYKTFVKQLREFDADKGYVMIEQIQITDMDEFYSRWKDGIRAKAKKLERLNGFCNFCEKRRWIAENPASDGGASRLGKAGQPNAPYRFRARERVRGLRRSAGDPMEEPPATCAPEGTRKHPHAAGGLRGAANLGLLMRKMFGCGPAAGASGSPEGACNGHGSR